MNPAFESLHEFAGEVPAACVHFMAFAFMSIWFNQLGQMPSYSKFCAQADWHKAFEYHKRVLKLLQWKNPRKHWVLKSPTHLRMMPTIRDVYPDACFIWPHRDPVRAIVSSVDLAGNMIWARSDDSSILGFEDFNRPERTADMLEQPIEWVESGRVPRERICNINYLDLIADPVATVQAIYEYFQVELTGRAKAAMEEYLRANPRSARPTHSLNDDVKRSISKERAVFDRYQKYFKVPTEI